MARINEIRKIPIRESLTTKVLIAGCEPLPLFFVFIASMLPMVLAFFFRQLPFSVIVFQVIIVTVGFGIARFISREDGYMFSIILRHSQYQTYYLAHEGYPGKKQTLFGLPRNNPIKTIETKSILI